MGTIKTKHMYLEKINKSKRPRFQTVGNFFPSHWNQLMSELDQQNVVSPKTNIFESDHTFSIQMAVPGMKKSDFKIDLEDRSLSVSAEQNAVEDRDIEAKDATQKKRFVKKEF